MEQQSAINIENLEDKEIKWGGLINEFLWTCAGVNKKVLRQCPPDYAKYAGTGGTILFTALMASISGAYALNFIFDSLYYSIPFGIFWGALIFNLDRFMVNTMYSDGKHTISWEEIKGGLPRIILAIFLGVVISTPIEMKIFDDVISENLPTVKAKADGKFDAQKNDYEIQKIALISRKDSLSKELTNQQAGTPETLKQLAKANEELNAINDKLYKELYGTGVTNKAGRGPAAKELERQQAFKQREVDQLTSKANKEALELKSVITENRKRIQSDIDQVNSDLAHLQKQIDEINDSKISTTQGLNHFAAQLEALYIGTSWEESHTLCIARLMVMLLFVIIEIVPTLFKMMVSFGAYDKMLQSEVHKISIKADKIISDINDHINTEVQISTEKNRNRLEAEVKANKDVLDRIALAQAELLQVAIDAWREEELEKIRANPSAYIRTNMSESNQTSRNTMSSSSEQINSQQTNTDQTSSGQNDSQQSSLEQTHSDQVDTNQTTTE
ncbi:MAG: DUF4407 domain-containing protein [Bacteroidales bacterium]|nr:DUF4407 domain-containing protein [Candidatus Physcocola equi]